MPVIILFCFTKKIIKINYFTFSVSKFRGWEFNRIEVITTLLFYLKTIRIDHFKFSVLKPQNILKGKEIPFFWVNLVKPKEHWIKA